MPAATLEKPAQKLAAPEKVAVFLSRRSGLKLVIKREQERKDAEGNVVETIAGQRVAFVDGKLRVPLSGKMRGEKGETLDAREVLTFLLGDEDGRLPHSLLGDHFDGFWRHEEPAPAPTDTEREMLSQLGMSLDVDGLKRFIEAEESGWDRATLLTDARSALARAEGLAAERAKEIADAEARGAAAKPKA